MDALSSLVADRGLLVCAALTLLVAVAASQWSQRRVIAHFPVLGGDLGSPAKRRKAFLMNPTDFYMKGYRQFKDRAFRLMTENGEKIVVPHSSLDYLRRQPDDVINTTNALYQDHHGYYTGVANPKLLHFLNHIVRGDLTHKLPLINKDLMDEIAKTFPDELGDCSEWTSVNIHQKLSRIVAISSGSVFFSPENCRDETIIKHAVDYANYLFMSMSRIKEWHPMLRWVGSFFIKELALMKTARKGVEDYFTPIIKDRQRKMARGEKTPNDVLQWMINKAQEHDMSPRDISWTQLELSFASTQTTTFTVSYILHDLVLRPELVEELREEVRKVLKDFNGELTTPALFQLKLMDSVMKESQRLNPLTPADSGPLLIARFSRLVQKPVQLPDGTKIPAGVMIQASQAGIVADPDFYPNPDAFDPYRYYKIRNGLTADPLKYNSKEQYQFGSVTKDFMGFGYGRHACPGRFFATNQVKLILAHVLLEYDIKMPEGLTQRYNNMSIGISSVPDPTKSILMKKVKVAL